MGENAIRRAKPCYIVPAWAGVLRRRTGIVVEGAQTICCAGAGIDTVVEVATRNGGFCRKYVIEGRCVCVEQRVGEAVRVPGLLVCQRHQPREDWAREAGAPDAIF